MPQIIITSKSFDLLSIFFEYEELPSLSMDGFFGTKIITSISDELFAVLAKERVADETLDQVIDRVVHRALARPRSATSRRFQ